MSRAVRPVVLAALLLGLTFGPVAAAADRIFVQIDGVRGGSTDRDHGGWIDAVALAHGMMIDCTQVGGSSERTCANPRFPALSFLKQTDASTPALFDLLNAGTTTPKVTVDVCRMNADVQECYYRVTLYDARIESLKLAADTCDDPTSCTAIGNESVDILYTRIEWRFTPFVGGRPGTFIERCWDVAAVQACQ